MFVGFRIIVFGFCVAVLSFANAFAADVTYKKDEHGRILVPVHFGDQVYNYLLATSSRRIGVRDGNLDALNIKRFRRSVLEEFSITGEVKLPMGGLPKMTLANRPILDRYVTIFNEKSAVAGVIGFDAFGEQLVHINPASQIVGLHAHAGNFASQGWHIINGRNNRYGGIIVQVEYMGVMLDVLFASSVSHSMLDLKAYSALKQGLPARKKRGGFADVMTGINATTTVIPTQLLPDFKIGGWALGDIEVVTSKLNVSDNASSGDALLLILGADVMTSREFTLDYRDFQIWYPDNQR
ncbi:hypothetical protein [Kordiimonas aquimaris]|uniref:hypothetical protein n=1 Tax=Kordiimonas aquimaris TaxID=707591 RepID=UPI0021D26F8A|nr:hypothetical protein [Kordiimonas aquimaris]